MALPPIPRDLLERLEGAIDTHGLANVLDGLAQICAEKADHVRANYNDAALSHAWESLRNACARAETIAAQKGL
jgi:predicted phage tail protein